MSGTLERQQLAVLALIKRRPVDLGGDPWLEQLASSRELDLVREIALWWRRFQIESLCRYTSRLLKRLGCFEREVEKYFEANATSPFIEQIAPAFLESLRAHPDPLLRSVAQFELACIRLREPSPQRFRIVWDRDPNLALAALDSFALLPAPDGFEYVMQVDAAIPGSVACVRRTRGNRMAVCASAGG